MARRCLRRDGDGLAGGRYRLSGPAWRPADPLWGARLRQDHLRAGADPGARRRPRPRSAKPDLYAYPGLREFGEGRRAISDRPRRPFPDQGSVGTGRTRLGRGVGRCPRPRRMARAGWLQPRRRPPRYRFCRRHRKGAEFPYDRGHRRRYLEICNKFSSYIFNLSTQKSLFLDNYNYNIYLTQALHYSKNYIDSLVIKYQCYSTNDLSYFLFENGFRYGSLFFPEKTPFISFVDLANKNSIVINVLLGDIFQNKILQKQFPVLSKLTFYGVNIGLYEGFTCEFTLLDKDKFLFSSSYNLIEFVCWRR